MYTAATVDKFLQNMEIATPCSQEWDNMTGDEKTRYCNSCELNVFNFAKMSKQEVANVVNQASCGGRVCVRIFRRMDGKVMTKDCPIGWKILEAGRRQTQQAYAGILVILQLVLALFLGKLAFDSASNYLQQSISQAYSQINKELTKGLNGGMRPPPNFGTGESYSRRQHGL